MSARVHTVAQGECMTYIAKKYGFADPSAIYHHPDNADLRAIRPNPNVLYPGDEVHIPDSDPKWVGCATTREHDFKLKSPKKKLVIVLHGAAGVPMPGVPYELVVGEARHRGKTDATGKLEHPVDALATTGTLALWSDPPFALDIGSLNPMDDCDDDGVSGVQARLNNLGYGAGAIDGELGARTSAAIRAFERDHGLEVTGEISDELCDALEKAHGS
jgi:N-acetylmuramoyl-L-alanine amidase